MGDLLYIVLGFGCFAAAYGLVAACGRLMPIEPRRPHGTSTGGQQ